MHARIIGFQVYSGGCLKLSPSASNNWHTVYLAIYVHHALKTGSYIDLYMDASLKRVTFLYYAPQKILVT